MIDTHCHLLPGIDDGPKTEAASIELSRELADAGVRQTVCTPHFSRRYPTQHSDAAELLDQLQAELARLEIDLSTQLAAEVSPAFAVTRPLEELSLRSIAGRFLLVELESDTPSGFLEALPDRLEEAGLIPILAHPERCRVVQRRAAVLDRLREKGALVQIVSPSLVGRWGRRTAASAWDLLESGRVDLIGSDAHGGSRGSDAADLAEASHMIVRRVGRDTYFALTEVTPALVLDGTHPRGNPSADERHPAHHA